MTTNYQLHLGDCVQWAKDYKGELFHALLTDPPYHLSTVDRFGKDDSAPAEEGVYNRSAKGFMGKQWDGGDIAFQPETWYSFMNVLHDGAFGFSFASSRGWHRLAVAIEDAGFIIHPSIFGWVFGSGFPKATRTEKQKVCETCKGSGVVKIKVLRTDVLFEDYKYEDEICPECNGENEEEMFDGHRYGLQALKPAIEPIIVFQKPYKGSARENIKETGAGVLNIEGGRIVHNEEIKETERIAKRNGSSLHFNTENDSKWIEGNLASASPSGRWPSNFYLDEEAAKLLNKQSNTHSAGAAREKGLSKQTGDGSLFGVGNHNGNGMRYGDEGGASRFFFIVRDQIDNSDPVRYVAKASRAERDAGLNNQSKRKPGYGYNHGLGNVGEGMFKDRETQYRNSHPTVKPLSLTQYLATLLLPPAEYKPRRLFVPFSGVASEMIGAIQAGWDHVDGVEITEEYIPIAEARLKHWTKVKPKNMEMF